MKTVKIILTQKSPACFANSRHKQNIYYTHDYIPGKSLWGFFIKKYVQRQKEVHPDFFGNNIRFSNCYVSIQQNNKPIQTLPVPLSLYTCKTHPYSLENNSNKGHPLFDMLFHYRYTCPQCQLEIRPLNSGFLFLDNEGKTHIYHPNKQIEMHNQIDKATQNTLENNLFAYELLDETEVNQFTGEIQISPNSPLLPFLLSFNSQSIELGKARTSGCGHFVIQIEDSTTPSPIQHYFKPHFDSTLDIYCYSDIIIMDKFNRYQTLITPHLLGLEKHIEMENSFTRSFQVEGFNAEHRKTKINDIAISKGSCFSYRIKKDADLQFINNRIESLRSNGLGLRLNEGFGTVFFNRIKFGE